MESNNVDMVASGGGPTNSRWNPTKEQISMLESLYSQGIRTPTAEQIQQITSRLKAYGHIEGKNVFYWFQNHKARQRQKQKQESMAYINRYLHKAHQPMFAPPCPNVVCGPYYLPQSDLGFYQQYPKVLLPGVFKRRARTEKMDNTRTYACTLYEHAVPHECYNILTRTSDRDEGIINNRSNNDQETLPLFPLQPTGILQVKATTMCSLISASGENSAGTPSSYSETNTGMDDGSGDKPFFDFFSGQDPCETD